MKCGRCELWEGWKEVQQYLFVMELSARGPQDTRGEVHSVLCIWYTLSRLQLLHRSNCSPGGETNIVPRVDKIAGVRACGDVCMYVPDVYVCICLYVFSHPL